MDKPEWIMLMLAANNNEPIKGITRFEKLLYFTLGKYFMEDLPIFGYEAYDFGPHSDAIRDVIYALHDVKLIALNVENARTFLEVDNIEYDDNELLPINYDKMEVYSLTAKGVEVANKIRDNNDVKEIDEIKKKLNSISLRELIRIVYMEFPEMTTKSIIRDEILN